MVISYINEKGGVGKTSLCYNVAYYMASLGKKILLIDLDGQRANLSFFSGIKDKDTISSMKDVLADGLPIKKAITNVPGQKNLDIVVGNKDLIYLHIDETNLGNMIKSMVSSVKEVDKIYDFIFIDVGPMPGWLHYLTMATSHYIIIPTLPDVAAIEAARGIITTYLEVKKTVNPGLKILGIVLNKFNSRTIISRRVYEEMDKVSKELETEVFKTTIRVNKALTENVAKHQGVTEYDPKSPGAADIIAFTSELLLRVK